MTVSMRHLLHKLTLYCVVCRVRLSCCHVVSCRVMSCRVISCHVMCVVSCHFVILHKLTYIVSCHYVGTGAAQGSGEEGPVGVRWILNIDWIYSRWILNIDWIYSRWILNINWIYSRWILNIDWIYSRWILNIDWIYSRWILNIELNNIAVGF
jgi:hypothetical protein